jgi:hypothetical protein
MNFKGSYDGSKAKTCNLIITVSLISMLINHYKVMTYGKISLFKGKNRTCDISHKGLQYNDL